MDIFQKLRRAFALLLIMVFSVSLLPGVVLAEEIPEISVYCNNEAVEFTKPPVIEDGRTLVPLRPVLEKMGCTVTWYAHNRTIKLQSGSIFVFLAVDETEMKVAKNSGEETLLLDVAPKIIEGSTFLPIRAVVEAFGATVQWNGETKRIDITYKKKSGLRPTERPIPTPSSVPTEEPEIDIMDTETEEPTERPVGGRVQNGHTFYYQSEPAWGFEDNGSGYCWVCAYAMLLNDLVGDVTPLDVAAVNESMGSEGEYCHHWAIVVEFGVTFTPAISKTSPYFKEYDPGRGATYLLFPEEKEETAEEKAETAEEEIPEEEAEEELSAEEIAILALKEALDAHPEGVLVRFDTYPHTILAVGYDEDGIYFHDPMNEAGGYDTEGLDGRVPFESTYNGHKGLLLSDMSYMQALIINE